jgi:hypothetical protein
MQLSFALETKLEVAGFGGNFWTMRGLSNETYSFVSLPGDVDLTPTGPADLWGFSQSWVVVGHLAPGDELTVTLAGQVAGMFINTFAVLARGFTTQRITEPGDFIIQLHQPEVVYNALGMSAGFLSAEFTFELTRGLNPHEASWVGFTDPGVSNTDISSQSAVPEPSSGAIFVLGIALAYGLRRSASFLDRRGPRPTLGS